MTGDILYEIRVSIVSDLSGFFPWLLQNVNFNALSMIKWHHSNRHHAKVQVIRLELPQNSILWRHYRQRGVGSISADDPIINKVEVKVSDIYANTFSIHKSVYMVYRSLLLVTFDCLFFNYSLVLYKLHQGNISMAWQYIMCLL